MVRNTTKEEVYWIPTKERVPDKNGEYLTLSKKGNYYISSWTSNLYKLDKYDFPDKKGKSGFYRYDSEYGYYEDTDVEYWMPLPKMPDELNKQIG